jgi:hypothetical protein
MKKSISLFLGIVLLMVMVSFALAESENLVLNNSTIGKNSTDSNVKNWSSVCDKVGQIVDNKIQAFDGGKVKRLNAYNNQIDMISGLVGKLSERGANATVAQDDLQNFKNKVNKFSDDYSEFVFKLENLKKYKCGNSSFEYAKQLREAKQMLTVLRNDSDEIKDTVIKIRLDLVQARTDFLTSKINERTEKIKNATGQLENRKIK